MSHGLGPFHDPVSGGGGTRTPAGQHLSAWPGWPASGLWRHPHISGRSALAGLSLFYEYFHGDNGAGLGASHQTGWTGVIARLLHVFATLTPEQMLEGGKMGYFETTA